MLELIRYFLYLGFTGFGGPLMLIEEMRQQYAVRNSRLSLAEFDQAFTLVKAMPGPIAFQMAVYLGRRFHGVLGGMAAGFFLLLPAFTMMILAGWFYDSLIGITFVHPILDGFLFSVSAIVLMSLKSLVVPNIRLWFFVPFVAINLFLCWLHLVPEPVLIVGFGLVVVAMRRLKPAAASPMAAAFLLVDWEQVYQLFKICLISGAVVFGTGFALIPVLKTNLVDVHQWLSLKEFNDGVIFGQMTPGPITITGTFLGYRIAGFAGALLATVGIFLMPLIHMVTWFPLAVRWLSRQAWINDFLLGATAAVVGSILTTLISMNLSSYTRPMFWVLFILTFGILLRRPKTSIILLVMGAGLVNLLAVTAAMYAV